MDEAAQGSTWGDRLRRELAQAEERTAKLKDFLGGDVYRALAPEDRALLIEQLDVMVRYVAVLKRRVMRLG